MDKVEILRFYMIGTAIDTRRSGRLTVVTQGVDRAEQVDLVDSAFVHLQSMICLRVFTSIRFHTKGGS